jgi:hypothetical protein
MIENLDTLKGPSEWIFQEDGAPCHMAKHIYNWKLKRFSLLTNWPANSPDLSPIENLCGQSRKYSRI